VHFPLVSIIIPVFNGDQYLNETIESVRAQTYTNWELIITNDGSTDNTGNLIKAKAEQDIRIKIIHQSNLGMGKARNEAIKIATADYLAFIDADDLWQPSKLEKQVNVIMSSGADLIYTSGHTFSQSTSNTIKFWQMPQGMHVYNDFFLKQLYGYTVPVLSVLVRKDKVIEVGGFVEDRKAHLAADFQLWLKLMDSKSCFYGIDEPLFFYRVHDKQSTAYDSLALDQVLWSMKFANLKSISVRAKYKVMEQRLNRYLIHNADSLTKDVMFKYIELYKDIFKKNIKRNLMKLAYSSGLSNFKRFGYKYLDLSESLD
jgi:teichuronic acid biosynthesis glycosyltransferase TuaG